MIPFKNLSRYFGGDIVAKALFFLAFIYLARVLGVSEYGTLEFALAITTYLLVLGDAGMELWATRESAQGQDVQSLIERVIPLRIVLAIVAFVGLLLILPVFPDYPGLPLLLALFGLALFPQALSLKWVFMGKESMSRVASGLVLTQIVFSLGVFVFMRGPENLFWVPVLRLVGDVAMVVFFAWSFVKLFGRLLPAFSFRGAWQVFRPAAVMGMSQALALVSYNLDSLLLGFLVGREAVGWYAAAYKPITAMLAVIITYYVGLFPTLSRTFKEDKTAFGSIVNRSIRLTTVLALPIGIDVSFLAGSIIHFLFGTEYQNSVQPLQILAWSAVLVILRGTFRQSLNAANRQDLDLRVAGIAIAVNVILNLLLIPQFEIVGAASATLVTDLLWLILVSIYFYRNIQPLSLLSHVWLPLIAAGAMGAYLWVTDGMFWMIRGATAAGVYFIVLFLLGEPEVRLWAIRIRETITSRQVS